MTSTQNLEALEVGDTVTVTPNTRSAHTAHAATVTEANAKRIRAEGNWYYRSTGKATSKYNPATVSA